MSDDIKDAVIDAADAETAASEAVAAAAEAHATESIAEAAATTVATAQTLEALSTTVAAKAELQAAETIEQTQGELQWLKSYADQTANSLARLHSQTQEIPQIKEAITGIAQALSALTLQLSPPKTETLEETDGLQIVKPVEHQNENADDSPDSGQTKQTSRNSRKRSPAPRNRVWI